MNTIAQIIADLDTSACRYALYYQKEGAAPVQAGSQQPFLSASIIKLPILLAWLRLERQGLVHRSQICDLDAAEQIRGAGFAWQFRARQLPYQDVLLMMIATSDNLCTNLVIRHAGLERLAAVIHEDLRLPGTHLERLLMDYAARAAGRENRICAADCIRLFDLFAALSPEEKAWVEPMLAANQDAALLLRDVPRDTLDFFHKTGSMEGVLHDWGYTRSQRLFLLTNEVASEPPLFELFGRFGRLLRPSGAAPEYN